MAGVLFEKEMLLMVVHPTHQAAISMGNVVLGTKMVDSVSFRETFGSNVNQMDQWLPLVLKVQGSSAWSRPLLVIDIVVVVYAACWSC